MGLKFQHPKFDPKLRKTNYISIDRSHRFWIEVPIAEQVSHYTHEDINVQEALRVELVDHPRTHGLVHSDVHEL